MPVSSTTSNNNIIITADEAIKAGSEYQKAVLKEGRSDNNKVVRDVYVDASWYLPNINRDPDMDYKMRRIVGSVRFDIDKIRDTSNDYVKSLPHMVPKPQVMEKWLKDNKINPNKDRLIVYTHPGSCGGPRVWWLFNLYGFNTVYLQGGLIAWEAADGPVEWGWDDNNNNVEDN
ncbi:hypothetical protein FOL47_011269, partial [Perkinsus chesapeaki]